MSMALFLAEGEIGVDSTTIGFPSLGGCMALALQTPHGLFGFHIPPGHGDRTPAFASYCTHHRMYGRPVHLFGSCKWKHRYSGAGGKTETGWHPNAHQSWSTEMIKIARDLGYSGPVTGFDITTPTSGITQEGSAYLEYTRDSFSGAVAISYAHMDAVDAPREEREDTTIRKILRRGVEGPYKNKVTVSVDPKVGTFSAVASARLFSFTV